MRQLLSVTTFGEEQILSLFPKLQPLEVQACWRDVILVNENGGVYG